METTHMTLRGRAADRDIWMNDRCSIDRTVGIVGTRSAILLLREASYGTTRFDDFVKRIGFTDKVAAARLGELVDAGLLERAPYQEPGKRTRYEYVLTPAGAELLPVLLALMQWGDRHLAGADGAPLALSHTGCGAPISVEVRCAAGHEVSLDAITLQFTSDARAQVPQSETTSPESSIRSGGAAMSDSPVEEQAADGVPVQPMEPSIRRAVPSEGGEGAS